MASKSRAELVRSIVAALGTDKYTAQLQAEAVATLEKLNTLPAETIEKLLIKAASKASASRLKIGQAPDLFDAASLSDVNVLLWGPPGRGKSMLADAIARRHAAKVEGWTVSQLVCPEDTQVSILAGSFQPSAGGSWQWIDGPVTKVLRTGGSLILDELAHLSPEACTWLLAALDRTPTLTLPSGETIDKAPVWTIATQNDTPASLLPPLADRLPIQQKVTLPFAWEWLGAFAPLAERDLSTQEASSLRPWAALRRMTDAGVPIEQSVTLLWPDSPSQLAAIKLAMDSQ
jgi:MoxR-like ATPase